MKVAFVTHCSDDWFEDGGCSKLVRSANYFHPEVPFIRFGTKELNILNDMHNNTLHWCNLNPAVSKEVAKHYDRVIHIDSDSMILGDLSDLLSAKEDVTVVRNNNDYDTASKFTDKPILYNGCKPEEYANAGLIASNLKEFWDYWIEQNSLYERSLPYREQDVLNKILQEKRFTHSFIDSKESKTHYGISCHYGEHTYWDSSKYIIFKEGGFWLKDKSIKIWHQAGGSHHFPKLNLDHFFNEETVIHMNSILEAPCEYIEPKL